MRRDARPARCRLLIVASCLRESRRGCPIERRGMPLADAFLRPLVLLRGGRFAVAAGVARLAGGLGLLLGEPALDDVGPFPPAGQRERAGHLRRPGVELPELLAGGPLAPLVVEM